jgi:hypothetical protein
MRWTTNGNQRISRTRGPLPWQQGQPVTGHSPKGERHNERGDHACNASLCWTLRSAHSCPADRARQLLSCHRAAVYRYQPFSIILLEARPEAVVTPLRLKIDPGSVITGLAVLHETSAQVMWAAELTHQGKAITARLLSLAILRSGCSPRRPCGMRRR